MKDDDIRIAIHDAEHFEVWTTLPDLRDARVLAEIVEVDEIPIGVESMIKYINRVYGEKGKKV